MSHQLIDSDDSLQKFVAESRGIKFYGIDTEFQRERTYYPIAGLIQIATEAGVVLVDPLSCDVSGLKDLFESDAVAIAHAVDQDIEVLRQWVGLSPRFVFDTQIAAGFLGYSTPALSALLHDYVGVEITKTDRLTDWTQRPLTDSQLTYAASDVAHLLELHQKLVAELEACHRVEWAQQECDSVVANVKTEIDPRTAWWRLKESRGLRGKSRLVAQEVAAWRELRARAQNLPVRFVLPDLAVAIIAQQLPKTIDDLRESRTIDGRHLKNGMGEELLETVVRALTLSDSDLRIPEVEPVDKSLRAVGTLLAAFIGQLGKEHNIDPSIVATRSDIDAFLSGRENSRLRTGWRSELVGDAINRLVRGDASLAFGEKGELVLEERSGKKILS